MTERGSSLTSGGRLLRLWEHGLACAGPLRADALLQGWGGEPAARTLGERNLRLLELHERLFGSDVQLVSHCPACATMVEFGSACRALAAHAPASHSSPHQIEIDGYGIVFRLPDGSDLAEASSTETEEEFVATLLDRCILACAHDGTPAPARELPVPILDAISREMEARDPAALLSFAVHCPQCGTAWNADLDVGQMVWVKVQAAAEQLLLEIDALARTYGWTEGEVLELDPLRRAAYLQLVNG